MAASSTVVSIRHPARIGTGETDCRLHRVYILLYVCIYFYVCTSANCIVVVSLVANIIAPVRLAWRRLLLLFTATDQLHGRDRGGDCDELKLLSDDTTFLNLRAHGGSISFLGTKVRIYKTERSSNHDHRYETLPGCVVVFTDLCPSYSQQF